MEQVDVESTGLSGPRTQHSNFGSESGALLSSDATALRAFTTVERPALQMSTCTYVYSMVTLARASAARAQRAQSHYNKQIWLLLLHSTV